jgi:hypothetical protein
MSSLNATMRPIFAAAARLLTSASRSRERASLRKCKLHMTVLRSSVAYHSCQNVLKQRQAATHISAALQHKQIDLTSFANVHMLSGEHLHQHWPQLVAVLQSIAP